MKANSAQMGQKGVYRECYVTILEWFIGKVKSIFISGKMDLQAQRNVCVHMNS
jgi:hypothetical protein